MKPILVVSLALQLRNSFKTERLFTKFLQKFSKAYPSMAEYDYRRQIFDYNTRLIEHANRLKDPRCPNNENFLLKEGTFGYGESDLTLRFAITDNADLTDAEFTDQYVMKRTAQATSGGWGHAAPYAQGFRPDQHAPGQARGLKGFWMPGPYAQPWPGFAHPQRMMQPAAGQIDHSAHFPDYKVKNQRNCGACWAASAATVVEMAHYLAHGSRVYLSYQELLDCCTQPSRGCTGGQVREALEYIQHYGLFYEQYKPYTARQGVCSGSAQPDPFALLAHPRRAWNALTRPDLARGDPAQMRFAGVRQVVPLGPGVEAIVRALALNPVVVSINISAMLRFYSSGVFESEQCRSGITDHNFVAVGYNLGGPKAYVKVLNSWGASWGMNGYALIAVYAHGAQLTSVCGLDTDPENFQVIL